jgi:hypothetical protein
VCLERGPLSLVSTTEELLERKVAAPVKKTEITAVGIRHADHVTPYPQKLALTSPYRRRSLGWYSSLADSGHGLKKTKMVIIVNNEKYVVLVLGV